MQKPLSFLAGVFCGLIVGAVASLLLAPESGMELRQQTREWLDDALAEARQAAEARRAELNDQFLALKRGEAQE